MQVNSTVLRKQAPNQAAGESVANGGVAPDADGVVGLKGGAAGPPGLIAGRPEDEAARHQPGVPGMAPGTQQVRAGCACAPRQPLACSANICC